MPSAPTRNRAFRLAARPVGLPQRSDWTFAEEPVPTPSADQALVEVQFVSLDPAMRGWMNDARSYIPPVKLGEVMRANAAGKVIASSHAALPVGTYVTGALGVQEYAAVPIRGLTPVD